MKPAQPKAPEHPPAMCATAGCPYDARVRVKRRRVVVVAEKPNPIHVLYGAWLNLCHVCNDRLVHEQNLEYCKAMDLDTPAKQRLWCLEQIKRGIGRREDESPLREPGADVGEAFA